MAEYLLETKKFGDSLRRCASDALYVHQNNQFVDEAESTEFRENLMTSVMKMMELDGEVHKYESLYQNLTSEFQASEDVLPSDEEMRKKWEEMESQMGTVKGPSRKHFKDIIKTIRDEKTEDGEDEMEVMQVQHSRKDPISKKNIVNPVINEKCGHVYDRDSVTEFAGKKRSIKCAMQGCSETIVIAKLVDFPEYWKNFKQ